MERRAVYADGSAGAWETIGDVEMETNVVHPLESGLPYSMSIVTASFVEKQPDGTSIRRTIELSRTYDGLPGDANLTGKVSAEDAADVLIYAAAQGAGETGITPYSGSDPALCDLSLRLSDTDRNGKINAEDAANILLYAAMEGAQGKADWDLILAKSH